MPIPPTNNSDWKFQLLNVKEEHEKSKCKLEVTTSELDTTKKRLKDSENEVQGLMEQITTLMTTRYYVGYAILSPHIIV